MLIYRQNYSALTAARTPIEPDPDLDWIESRIRGGSPTVQRTATSQHGTAEGRLPNTRPSRPTNYAPPILLEIERTLKRTGMTATSFGKEAVGDGRLVSDLRKGRDPSSRVVARVRAFIAAAEKAAEGRPKGKSAPALDLLPRIQAAIAVHGMLPSRFGRNVSNDPGLIDRIGSGAGIRHATREKIVTYLARLEGRL